MRWMRPFLFILFSSNVLLAKCLMIHSNVFHERTSTALATSRRQVKSGFRPTQSRKKHVMQKESGYWKDTGNIENEIRSLWESVNVNVPPDEPPPIPNESLLNYWKRHDLRYAISQIGGRDILSEEMNNAFVVPGKWREASETMWVKKVIANDQNLDPKVPPLSPQQEKRKREDSRGKTELRERKRWVHKKTRRKKGFWRSEEVVIEELYSYLYNRRNIKGLPAVWMPKGNELNDAGRNDLHQAITRFGGSATVGKKAGLIPPREWHYLEGMRELMIELRAYCDEYFDGDYSIFPTVYTLDEQGYERLKSLIGYFGGQRFVAQRLGMVHASSAQDGKGIQKDQLSWGKFDLVFGIDLLEFVRNEMMKKTPPLQYPVMTMPTFRDLLNSEDEEVVKLELKINKYGGYENVARRMGLEYTPNNPQSFS